MKSFEGTDSRPYNRHRYRVIFQDGSSKDAASYAEATDVWYASRVKPVVIDVLPAAKGAGPSGFG